MSDESKPQLKPETVSQADQSVIEPGPIAQRLIDSGISAESLGFDSGGVEMFRVQGSAALEAATYLKGSLHFDLVVSVAGVDWKTHRESVYHIFSTSSSQFVTLKIPADAEDRSPSLYPVWPAVDWHERESYDLMGICYEGHPMLKRILMPDDWVGHPLRKDYKEDDPRLVWNRR